ncbi:MAG TPA: class I SAM-dependent methyltransferase [Candidatus Dormibacteraeota bacterium]
MEDDLDARALKRDLVRRGYDAISKAYRDDSGAASPETDQATAIYAQWVRELAPILPRGARVLDLGCGCGLPATRLLVKAGFEVVGVDFSAVQIQRARELVPDASFIQADMVTWEAEPASFDAVVSFYALIHVPLEDQKLLLPRIRQWLRSEGLFLATFGDRRWTGSEQYLGTTMFWDHADARTYLRWLKKSGFNPLWNRFIPEGASGHALILSRATAPPTS